MYVLSDLLELELVITSETGCILMHHLILLGPSYPQYNTAHFHLNLFVLNNCLQR